MARSLNPRAYETDKPTFDVYFRNYERVFAPYADRDIRLLELGINQGGSLKLWRDYFDRGTISAIDINPVTLDDPTGRIRVYQGLQQDTALLDRVRQENAPEGFDIIIDDCSHVGEFTAISFWHLFDRHLKPGGLYVIEDWGTGYMAGRSDGRRYRPHGSTTSLRSRLRPFVERLLLLPSLQASSGVRRVLAWGMNHLVRRKFPSHQMGLVGFVKQLVDEAGMDDITCPPWGSPPYRPSRFARLEITHGQAFIIKASP